MDQNQAFNVLVQGIHAGVKAGAYTLDECAALHSAIKLLTTPPQGESEMSQLQEETPIDKKSIKFEEAVKDLKQD